MGGLGMGKRLRFNKFILFLILEVIILIIAILMNFNI